MFSPKTLLNYRALAMALLVALTLGGCDMMTDPDPEIVVNDVRDYYYKLEGNAHYEYEKYFPDGSEKYLGMEMKGKTSTLYNGRQVYLCMWDYYQGSKWPYYFALDKDAAVYLETSETPKYAWVDLQSPLKLGAAWSFQAADAETVQAKVTKVGAKVTLEEMTFSDVIEVTYTSPLRSRIQWFVKDIGLIYLSEKDAAGKLVYSQMFEEKG